MTTEENTIRIIEASDNIRKVFASMEGFTGDTFFIPSMTEIGKKYKLDVAFLPIGGNRFFGFKMVMDPKDAALATEEVKSKIVIPIHFGTFRKIPMMFSMNGTPSDFLKYVKNNKIQTSIKISKVGETYDLG